MSMLERRGNVAQYKKADGRLGLSVAWPEDASGAKQSFKNECDINWIMRKYPTQEMRERLKRGPGISMDLSSVPDLDAAMRVVAEANQAFDSLSAAVRERFRNSPTEFLKFMEDGSNAEEMVKLGLMSKEAIERVTAERAAKAAHKNETPATKSKGAAKRSAAESDDSEPTS